MSGGRAVDPDQIIVSSGSKQSIFNACFTLFGPKDRVLIPAPAWVSYPQIVHLARAEPVLVPGDLEWGLKVSARDLDRASNKLTRGLILCSPCNPTGAVYTLAELRAIAEWAKSQRGLDHLGRDLSPDQLRPGPGALAARSPGRAARARRGHLRREQGVRDDRLAHRRGARAAPPDQGHGRAPVAHHDRRQPARPVGGRRRVHRREGGRGSGAGWWPRSAAGATCWWTGSGARLPASSSSSRTARSTSSSGWTGSVKPDPVTGTTFCEQLMKQEGVALVPGGAFADDRWVRLSYAVSDGELEQALDRILGLIHRLASAPCRLRPSREHGSAGRAADREPARRSAGAGIPRPTSSRARSRATGRAAGSPVPWS